MKYISFSQLVHPFVESAELRQMHQFMAHGHTTVFEHSYLVARLSYGICKRLPFKVDIQAVIAGAMLHDFYLYDWHIMDAHHKWHGKTHGYTAYRNASKVFKLNEKEKNIIEAHMWPLNITEMPRSKEAVIVSIADKMQATYEFFNRRKPCLGDLT